jgi:hypothetical protein
VFDRFVQGSQCPVLSVADLGYVQVGAQDISPELRLLFINFMPVAAPAFLSHSRGTTAAQIPVAFSPAPTAPAS